MKQRIYFNEVVTRDGFQMEPAFVPTDTKVELINELSQCGYSKIEVTSFTSAKAIPMLRDAEEVMGRIERAPNLEYTVLVPNVRGAERAMDVKPDEFNLVMSTSETHNLSNLRMPRENSFSGLREVIQKFGALVPINVSLSACFGCPMEGDVAQAEVLRWSQRFADLGVRGLTICDTTGMAQPSQVAAMCEVLQKQFPSLQLTLHFHNTRGMGLANALAAVEAGINRFDSSLGGLGGCPYAPGATGNICTEELVHMFDLMGYNTNMNLDLLLECSAQLRDLVGRTLPSQLLLAGKVDRLYDKVCQS
jgi:hydroxymethylglutaryl-CoA lyase